MLSRARHAGFTMIELMVAAAIVAIGLALSAPSMSAMLQNSKLTSAARSYYAGMQTARSEAIRRNLQVEFVLTNSAVTTANVANGAAPNAGGQNWLVRAASGPAGTSYSLVEAKSGGEGANQSSGAPSVSISGAPVAPATVFDGIIAFNGFGEVVGANAYDLTVSNPAGGACASAGGPMRCLRIRVAPGGQLQLCDPAVAATATGDSRRCV